MHRQLKLPQGFAILGVEVQFLKALVTMQFQTPSDIQQKLIPPALAGRDILGQAKTGTGKTAAFAIPALQRTDPEGRLQTVCLAPTRELAVQVAGEMRRLAEFTNLHVVPVYGGQKISTQIHLLGRKPHVIVGTPGRCLDLMRRQVLQLDSVHTVILDEVDRMLDIGFRDDIRKILSGITQPHQTIFVSATIDDEIRKLAYKFMNDPLELDVSRDEIAIPLIEQVYCSVQPEDKFELLCTLLREEKPKLTIVFTNTKHQARKLAKKLFAAGVTAKEIHGDLVQQRREKVMSRFRKHTIDVLVATDLASRGIDVAGITHIINYDIPPDPHAYIHRIGRTARMGASGRAITFVTREQGRELTEIEKLVNQELGQLKFDSFVPKVRAAEGAGLPATGAQRPPARRMHSPRHRRR